MVSGGAFPLIAEFRFFPNGLANTAGQSLRSGDRQGRYPPQTGVIFSATFGPDVPNYVGVAKAARGIDTTDGQLWTSTAPANAIVVSPLTTLLSGTNTESKLRSQLTFPNGVTLPDRPLTTSSPYQSSGNASNVEASVFAAYAIRVMAIAATLQYLDEAPDPSGTKNYDMAGLTRYLEAEPAQSIFTDAAMEKLLRNARSSGTTPAYRADVYAAAAHFVASFCLSTGLRNGYQNEGARYKLAIFGYLIPELRRLFDDNSAAAAAALQAITIDQVRANTARFEELWSFDPNATFFAQPDFYTIARNGSYTVPAAAGPSGNGPLTSNDVIIERSPTDTSHFVTTNSRVTTVTVPGTNSTQVVVSLNFDGGLTIRPAAGFSGITYFDYVATTDKGDTANGRVWVNVR